MNDNRITLPQNFVNQLLQWPESGMGYQLVNVFLKDGGILKKHVVLNASVLVLNPNEHITPDQIEKLEPESK